MKGRDIATLSLEEISRCILDSTVSQLNDIIPLLTPDQVSAAVSTLDVNQDTLWQEKLTAIIQGLTDTKQLEAAGKALTLAQAMHLLDESQKSEHNGHWKLSPLLVGMPHRLFTQMLLAASHSQMHTLKQEVITESLQHHLTVLTHEIVHQIPEFAAKTDDLEQEITALDIKEMGLAELKEITHKIEESAEFYEETINKINKALTLAWNTNRTDLIDKLSVSKEISQKLIGTIVGSRRSRTHLPTGLFAKLEERLNEVYGIADDPKDIEALEDDEPAIEALAKLSIWYLRDYWEIGLLPKVKTSEEFEFENAHLTHDQKVEFREKCYQVVNDNLSKLGLNTVKDLKNARIFSKATLVDYITRNAKLIK